MLAPRRYDMGLSSYKNSFGGITYSILKPSTKMDETKEAQNINGNVLGGGKAAA
ncbi:MAG: hypothetical protein ACEY3L_17845 [Wolbachia sp.]